MERSKDKSCNMQFVCNWDPPQLSFVGVKAASLLSVRTTANYVFGLFFFFLCQDKQQMYMNRPFQLISPYN